MPSRLLMPHQRAIQKVANQGWMMLTAVRPSMIPRAGNGRYALQAMPAQSRACFKPIVAMSSIDSLLLVPANRTVTFESADELEKYVKLCAKEGGFTREVVHDEFENFIYSVDGKKACMNHVTWTVNHADNFEQDIGLLRMEEQILDDGSLAVVSTAVGDIRIGDELRNSYRADFDMPSFYVRYCRDNGFKDVRTNTLNAVDAASRSPAAEYSTFASASA